MNGKNRWVLIPMALFAIIVSVQGIVRRRAQEEAARPYGCLTAQQVLERTAQICRAVCPEAPGLQMEADPLYIYTRARTRQRIWQINYSDARGRFPGLVIWDADTGDLIALTRMPSGPAQQARRLFRREIQGAAQNWLIALGLSRPGSRWQIAHPLQQEGEQWSLVLRSDDRIAYLRIDACSGSLIRLATRPLASANPFLIPVGPSRSPVAVFRKTL